MADPTYVKLSWDGTGERYYEMGISKGVLYPYGTNGYEQGVAWNGLTSVTESPDGAEPTDLYADDIKYASLRSAETFGGTIEAYTYPEEFAACDGTASPVTGAYVGQQKRKSFGLCYRTQVGDDQGNENYKLHIVYGAVASPSEKAYETVNDSPDAITFSWEFKTTPVAFSSTGSYSTLKPTSLIVIDSTKADATKLAALEDTLYGDGTTKSPSLPTPDQVLAALA